MKKKRLTHNPFASLKRQFSTQRHSRSFLFKFALASFVFTYLSGCSYIVGDNLILENRTRYPVNSLIIKTEDVAIWEGELEPREQLELDFRPPKEGMIKIVGVWNGQQITSGEDWAYATPDISNEHRFELRDDGQFYDF